MTEPTTAPEPSVLFVCVHNAGRSQMATGWLTHLAGDTVEVRSASSAPAESINPVAVDAMREVGIEVVRQVRDEIRGRVEKLLAELTQH
ncbi:hypothetical protein [Cryptosporangium japonicum]|uniref:Phosphotyrosine protein phosphatase I domain-containing protein n=1 Tax=Cryptosporangium japonicum TaxID=80872 RepID=A0ABN0TS04_9ACTN